MFTEKLEQIKMLRNKQCAAGLLVILLLGMLPILSALGAQQEGTAKPDYSSIRRELLEFEAALNDLVNSSFSASPFAVVQKAKGAYLQGYGLCFAFMVNIHRAVRNTPFGPVRVAAPITQELKKQRIDELKERLIRLLKDHGENLRMLRKEEYVTIIAYVEDRNFPDEPGENKTIVLAALKKDLDEFGRRSNGFKEFKQRIKIVEY